MMTAFCDHHKERGLNRLIWDSFLAGEKVVSLLQDQYMVTTTLKAVPQHCSGTRRRHGPHSPGKNVKNTDRST